MTVESGQEGPLPYLRRARSQRTAKRFMRYPGEATMGSRGVIVPTISWSVAKHAHSDG